MDGIKLLLKTPFENVTHLPGWSRTQTVLDGGEIVTASPVWRIKNPFETITYNQNTEELYWSGSLQKHLKGNNYSGFTYREFQESVGTLADLLNCKPVDLAVINAEISATIQQQSIHERVKSFNDKPFSPMEITKGASKVYGAVCRREQYGAKVYDKTMLERAKVGATRTNVPDNLTQAEFLIRDKRFFTGNGFNLTAPPTLADLVKPEVYQTSFNHLIAMTKQLQIDNPIDWAYVVGKHNLSPAEFGKVLTMHDPAAAAFLKEYNYETYKKNMKLYRSVKYDLSPAAATTSEAFQRAVEDAVQLKFDF
ncbi:hypothetical protein [Hymenobacter rigui]|uniref:Uncharacterized protein n=1 Tax=Hymenobacter rigui TaxID=334424 RepID=A0A3R9UYW9_9BACT|nr:hypothetical protein [Hymenobacter rigui]RSK43071.1 hypothetical protein EI291_22485 [Hymenobacter rigui]